MDSRKQNSQLKNAIDSELYSSTLRKIAALLTSCSNLEDLFIDLHSYIKKLIPHHEFKLGLLTPSPKYINWIFVAENNTHQFWVSKSEIEPFLTEAFSKEQSTAYSKIKEDGTIEICSVIRLYSQNLGIITLNTSDDINMPKRVEFLDLVSFFLAFVFADLQIEDDKLVRHNFSHEELINVKHLNKKLLSIIDVARSLAHELNQPLTGISGYCTLIMETIKDGESQAVLSDLGKILEQAARLENLIFKFQSIAHIEDRTNKIIK